MSDDHFRTLEERLTRLKTQQPDLFLAPWEKPKKQAWQPSGLEVYRVHCFSQSSGDCSLVTLAVSSEDAEDQARQWVHDHGFNWTVKRAEALGPQQKTL